MPIDRRQYYRRRFADEAPTAVLVYDRTRIRCWLVEMSLGGFAVLVPEELKIAADSLARFHAQGLEYIVRITRQESLGDCVLVGMVQVEEVVSITTTVPSGPTFRWLTTAAWAAALGTIALAVYLLPAWHR